MDKTRVYGEQIAIDYEQVKEFYNKRALAFKDSPSTVNLQNDRELAKGRDTYEKEQIIPKLELNADDKAFEFGCGFGRFADALVDKVAYYKGYDISSELIKLAKDKYQTATHLRFVEGDVDAVTKLVEQEAERYNLLLAMGVLMYLNDQEAKQLVANFCQLASQHPARIYIRESVALIPERLTLNGFWSDSLQDSYTAIYRTIPEYEKLFEAFIENGFQLADKGLAYPQKTANPETTQYYFIFTR